MSLSEVERFVRDLKSSPALQAELAKDDRVETVVSVAQRHRYGFTLDDLKAFARARAGAAGRELSAADLDAMAGGGNMTPGQKYLDQLLGDKGRLS